MKRYLATLLCLLFAVLSGCSPVSLPPDPPITDSSAYENAWCYRHLSATLQADYAAVYQAVTDNFGQDSTVTLADGNGDDISVNGLAVTLPEPLSDAAQIEQLYTALLRDQPLFFHIGSTYSYEGYRIGDRNVYKSLYLTYTMDAATRQKAAEQLETAVAHALDGTQGLDSQYKTELWLHDMLLNSCVYNEKAADSDTPLTDFPQDFTAYGALVKGRAVCEGYACAMQLLLTRAGMDATSVSGFDAEGRPHMWNLVSVDGSYYYVDATWNDRAGYISHLYFNLSTEELRLSHTLDDENFGLEDYTDTSFNYFVQSGRYIDHYDRTAIASLVADAVNAGETCIELRFAEDKYANARLFINNIDWFCSQVNQQLPKGTMWPYEYFLSPLYHTIAICKKT